MLVIRAQLGDNDAFQTLAERYHRRLTYYVRRFLEDEERAEDVIQSVWLAAFQQLPTLRHCEAFRVWLYRIAHSKAMRAIRDDRRYVALEEEESIPEPMPEEEGISPADAAQVHAALNRLKPPHKEVLVLRFLEDMPYQEIAEVIGIGLGTVRSRIYYAKRALKYEMEAAHHEPGTIDE